MSTVPKKQGFDKLIATSKSRDGLFDAFVPFFESREYRRTSYSYPRLFSLLSKTKGKPDLAPLIRAYDRSKSVEARIWFAALADYYDNRSLLKELSKQVPSLRGEARALAALAVAFKSGATRMLPYLIEALPSKARVWKDNDRTHVASAAGYMLTALTNHHFGDYPNQIEHFSCWSMPPPVIPYPVPFDSDEMRREFAQAQPRWQAWWQANKSNSQKDWILEGLNRDVDAIRATKDIEKVDELVLSRLERFLEINLYFEENTGAILNTAWDSAQRRYEIPFRYTK